ncbi:DEAD/DEAH box helicase [Enterobacter hormaechei]|uniref:DEAD/DEAH box helicase n=1 Tax=Enterobacteriaceae TaxID=543 RepID=UPI0030F4AAE0
MVASSVEHAFELLNILEKEFAKTATVVTYHDKQAISKIDRFRNGTTEWIVSVGMISEGTDIPRQQVWYHLSTVKTELYFRQILGRIVRINRFKNQEAWLFTIATQELTLFAERLAEELPEQYRIIQIENTLPAGATHIHASEPDVRKKEFRVIDTENGHSCNSMDLNGTGPKNASFDKPGTYFTINSLHQRVINAFLPTDSKHQEISSQSVKVTAGRLTKVAESPARPSDLSKPEMLFIYSQINIPITLTTRLIVRCNEASVVVTCNASS